MKMSVLQTLWENITIIEAQEQLKQMTVNDWPNMSKSGRNNLHRDIFKQAYPSQIQQKNYVDIKDLSRVLGR